MIQLNRGVAGALAAISILAASPAAAVTHILDLTGTLDDANGSSFSFGGNTLSVATLDLGGFDPFTLEDGDVIEYSISLSGFMFGVPPFNYFVIPAASAGPFGQLFGVNFGNYDFTDPVGASNSGSATLSGVVGDITGVSLDGACGNCLAAIMGRSPGPFAGFGFSGLSGTMTVSLAEPYYVDRVTLSYQVQTGLESGIVPEPASWAMLIAGFGLVGATLRRRRALATA